MDTRAAESFRRDARVLGVIGLSHDISHFLRRASRPLFPTSRAQFDVSWTLPELRRRGSRASSIGRSREVQWANGLPFAVAIATVMQAGRVDAVRLA